MEEKEEKLVTKLNSTASADHTKLPTGDHSPAGSFFYIANSDTVSLSILAPFSSALWYT